MEKYKILGLAIKAIKELASDKTTLKDLPKDFTKFNKIGILDKNGRIIPLHKSKWN